mgnify:CR=1 FL=1
MSFDAIEVGGLSSYGATDDASLEMAERGEGESESGSESEDEGAQHASGMPGHQCDVCRSAPPHGTMRLHVVAIENLDGPPVGQMQRKYKEFFK